MYFLLKNWRTACAAGAGEFVGYCFDESHASSKSSTRSSSVSLRCCSSPRCHSWEWAPFVRMTSNLLFQTFVRRTSNLLFQTFVRRTSNLLFQTFVRRTSNLLFQTFVRRTSNLLFQTFVRRTSNLLFQTFVRRTSNLLFQTFVRRTSNLLFQIIKLFHWLQLLLECKKNPESRFSWSFF